MIVIIAGVGNVGRYLLEQFDNHDAKIIVIELDQRKIDKIRNRYDVMVRHGNMLSHYILRSANVASCDFFIASTNRDADNIVACQLAKRMGAGKTIARIYSEDIFPYDFNQLEDYLGIDWVVSPSRLSGYNLAYYLHQNQDIILDNYFSNQMDIAKLTVSEQSSLQGMKVSKIQNEADTLLVSLLRDGQEIGLNEVDQFQLRDEIILIGKKQKIISLLHKLFKDIYKVNEKIYVAGTSSSCLFGISILENQKNHITLFEKNQEICVEIEEKYRVKVINLDPSDFNQLKDYQPDTDAVFICASDNDAENLTYALNAEELGFKTIIPIVNEYDKMRLFERFSFSHLVSLPYLSSKEIFRLFSQEITEDFELLDGVPIYGVIREVDAEPSWSEEELIKMMSPQSEPRIVAIQRKGEILLAPQIDDKKMSLSKDIHPQKGDKLLLISKSQDHHKILQSS